MNSSDLPARVKTAAIIVVPVVVLLFLGVYQPAVRQTLVGVAFVLVGLSAFEYARVCSASADKLRGIAYFLSIMLAPLAALFLGYCAVENAVDFPVYLAPALLYGLYGSFLLYLLYVFVVGRHAAEIPRQIAQDLLPGVFLVGLGGAALISFPVSAPGIGAAGWLIAVVAANDIGAYFTGRAIGGMAFASYLSPKKTVSGSLGGGCIGVAIGVALSGLLPGESAWYQSASLALLVGIAAQAGDLGKSYVKRLHGVKDMGTILPGHGGVLDRIDGLLCAAPAVYFYWVLSLL